VSISRPLPIRRYVVAATSARMVAEGTAIAMVLVGTDRGLGSAALGVLVACWTLPQVVTAPFVGTVADRAVHPARLLGGFVSLGAVGLAAVGAGLGSVPIAALAVVAALISLAEPALMGALSGIATRSAGPRFEAWDALSYGSAGICVQLLVGAVSAVAGPVAALGVLVAVGVAAALLVGSLPLRGARDIVGRALRSEDPADAAPADGAAAGGRGRDGRERSVGALAALTLIGRDRDLRTMTVLTTISMSAFGGVALVAVDLAEHHGHPAASGSHLVLAMAIGALAGSLAWTRLPAPSRPMRTAAVSVAVVGLAFAATAVAGWAGCLVAFAIAGVADAPLLVATFATRNRRSPASVRASVYTVSASMKIAATSVGAVAAGILVGWRAGVSGPLTLAVIQAVALVAFGVSRWRGDTAGPDFAGTAGSAGGRSGSGSSLRP
jgi:hypothetical protein